MEGNRIGTDATGLVALGNRSEAVAINSAANNNTIRSNVIAASGTLSATPRSGIRIYANGLGTTNSTTPTGITIQNNYIGTNVNGAGDFGNLLDGIRVEGGGGESIIGNVVSNNRGVGINLLNASSGNVIQGNNIGTDATGLAALRNYGAGIIVTGPNNTIGGTTVAARNVISGNTGTGIVMTAPAATGNLVAGNFIGTDSTGTAALPNGVTSSWSGGVELAAPGNTIGGTAPGAGNVISGNAMFGVTVGTGAANSVLQGNFIGTTASGTGTPGVQNWGVVVYRTPGFTVGGTAVGAGNVISGNAFDGIVLQSDGVSVQGNFIGTDSTGATPVPNGEDGIQVENGSNNVIGGTVTGARNLISGNLRHGVNIYFTTSRPDIGAQAFGNTVLGNFIGTDVTGALDLGNAGSGVYVGDQASGNTIGGSTAAARNVISGNDQHGVVIESDGNTVQFNSIGTNAAGTAAIPNTGTSGFGGAGVFASGANTHIADNLISGNAGPGVWVRYDAVQGTQIVGNQIGTNAAGTAAIGNTGSGVMLTDGATGVTIGGRSAGDGNVISGNLQYGISLTDSSANLIQGNLIGTDTAGANAIGNATGGIYLASPNNTVGGTLAGARNVISGNSGPGVLIASGVTNTIIQGNYIGTDKTGALSVGNDAAGVEVDGGAQIVGGSAAGAGNVIAYNGFDPNHIFLYPGPGIWLKGPGSTASVVSRNSIFGNAGLGIDLSPGTPTGSPIPNDSGDTDGVPNSPVITRVTAGLGVVEVEGFARPGTTIEFYLADGLTGMFLAARTEGSVADTNSTTGSYSNASGSDTTNRFHFTIPIPQARTTANSGNADSGGATDTTLGAKVVGLAVAPGLSQFGNVGTADLGAVFGAPVIFAGSDATILEGQQFSGHGSFSDLDSSEWVATIDYGDGTGVHALRLNPPEVGAPTQDGYANGATDTFDLSHVYAAAGTYTVVVRVTDDSGATGTDALTVVVVDAPPSIDNNAFVVTPTVIGENGVVSVTGTFSDASPTGTHEVSIIWGDGTASTATVDESAHTFEATHVYRNNPVGQSAGVYGLQAIVRDANGAGAQAATIYGLFFVEVDNITPSGLTVVASPDSSFEGNSVALDGSFTDPAPDDPHRVDIDWGDGSPHTVLNLAPGVTSFNGLAHHQYLNNPAAPTASYTITASVTDADEPLAATTATASVNVANVAPSGVILSLDRTNINENDAVSLSGSFTDPGALDAHTVVIHWGDGSSDGVLTLPAGTTSFAEMSHTYLNNPHGKLSGSFPITVTVTDVDGATANASAAVTVADVAPVVSGLTLDRTAVSEFETVVATGTFSDVGTLDRHTVRINWGDGTASDASVNAITRSFTAEHTYEDNPSNQVSGQFTVTATVTDDDGLSDHRSAGITVANVVQVVQVLPAADSTAAFIHVVSTVSDPGRADTFTYHWTATDSLGHVVASGTDVDFRFPTPGGSTADVSLTVTDQDGVSVTQSFKVVVLTDDADTYVATTPSDANALMILGLGGDDFIDASAVSVPCIIDGGADPDTMLGGTGDDVILLHQGNDAAYGGGGDDAYLLTPNSTLTIVDGLGDNVLDFGAASFGVTFDLTLTAGQSQDVNPLADPGQHFVSVNDLRSGSMSADLNPVDLQSSELGTGRFNSLAGSIYSDSLTAATDSTVKGGDGADLLYVKADTANAVIDGGADADQLTISGANVVNITFTGDDGANVLTNLGTNVGGITFLGGSDADQLFNVGSATQITFAGGSDADQLLANTLQNNGSVGTIIFTGGSDADQLINQGTVVSINFNGDDGANLLQNAGTVTQSITFAGGSDADQLITTANSSVVSISFSGDDGANLLQTAGSVGAITFAGGSDADQLLNAGTVVSINFSGDDGANVLTNQGVVSTSITFIGGSDADQLITSVNSSVVSISFSGDDGANLLQNAGSVGAITFTGGSDADQLLNMGTVATVNFGGDDGANVLTNQGVVSTSITFTGGSDADQLINEGTVVTISFNGDDGANLLQNAGAVSQTITFTGGSDADQLITTATSSAGAIVFTGDDGANLLQVAGNVGTITVTGGSDADQLLNMGTVVSINFGGDDGANLLTNQGVVTGAITFTGGSDADQLVTTAGSTAVSISFNGDDGANLLQHQGTVTSSITFTGGSDADQLVTTVNSTAGSIVFDGDDGANLLVNYGSVATINFTGGSDADQFLNAGTTVSEITFAGDDGANALVNVGTATQITFTGGSDSDFLQNSGSVVQITFTGDDGANVLVNDGIASKITFSGGSDADQLLTTSASSAGAITFSGDDGANLLVNYGAAQSITFNGGSDADAFQNNAPNVGQIVFTGDDGANVFQNNGAAVGSITFTGGADPDFLQNTGATVVQITFTGDDGANVLVNTGTAVGAITYTGGSDADTLQNNGDGIGALWFDGGAGNDRLENNGNNLGGISALAPAITYFGDDGADVLINRGTNVAGITFVGGSDADQLLNVGSNVSNIVFAGDDGANVLVNNGAAVIGITFTGGSDSDQFLNAGESAANIVFNAGAGANQFTNQGQNVSGVQYLGGDDSDTFWNIGANLTNVDVNGGGGSDRFVNDGNSASGLVFRGGAGDDSFTNNGLNVTADFQGGDGNDVFQNSGTGNLTFGDTQGANAFVNSADNVTTITFVVGGGIGANSLTNFGNGVGTINFTGGAGPDTLINAGGDVGAITFDGRAGSDLLQNSGVGFGTIAFNGGDGTDSFINTSTGRPGSVISFIGGIGDDLLVFAGHADSATFDAGAGDDRAIVFGNGALTVAGGAGGDTYTFAGTPQVDVTIQENYQAGDSSNDSLDFSAFYVAAVTVDLSSTVPQHVATGITLTLSSALGLESVIGTTLGDNLTGNGRDGTLAGAALIAPDTVSPAPAWNGVTQWVYLDFDSFTDEGEHAYSQAERDAIQARIEADYHGPDPAHPWFHVQFTQHLQDIPANVRANNQFVSEYFNRTPSFNRAGGESSELDFGNENLGGFTVIQVNGLTGGANQPDNTSTNFVLLSAKIAAHELAHLMGVLHEDSFGPIGFGLHSPPGSAAYNPFYTGPDGAFETFSHIISSPATVGSTRFTDLGDVYFGQREAIKLAFAERGTTVGEASASHNTIQTAQPLALAALPVPNTEAGSLNAGTALNVAAVAVTGHIGIDSVTGHSQSDFYAIHGRKGDLFTIEVLSTELSRLAGHTIDSMLRVYDSAGNLVPYYGGVAVNDDQFEPTDSALFDLLLPADGTYYVQVDTFVPTLDPTDPNYNPIYDPQSASYAPNNVATILSLENPNFDQNALNSFLNVVNDTTTGDYTLFLYKFGAASATDLGDRFVAGSGNETILTGPGADVVITGTGHYMIDFGDGSTPLATVPSQTVLSGSLVTLAPAGATSSGPIAWQVFAPDGTSAGAATRSLFEFVPTQVGTYTVLYTVTSPGGDSLDGVTTVTVEAPPSPLSAQITGGPGTVLRDATVTLGSTADHVNGTLIYAWRVNGVLQSGVTGSSFTLTPAIPGDYDVALTVTDSVGSYSDVETIVARPAVTSTTVVTSTGTVGYGHSVDFTATVSLEPAATGSATGFVQFAVDGASFLSPVQLVMANGIPTATLAGITTLSAGTHTVAATYLGDVSNSTSTGTLAGGETVTPAPLTVTATNQSKIYGGADPNLTYAITGTFYNGDDPSVISGLTLATETGAAATAGTHTIVVSGATAANYAITLVNGTLTVSRASLTVAADDKSKTYGAADPTLTYTVSGDLYYGDTSAVVSGVGLSAATGAAATAGTHSIQVTGGTAANYVITDVNGTLTVSKAGLTVTACDKNKVYGAADPTLDYTVSGTLYYGDTAAVVSGVVLSTTTGSAATAGTHTISATAGSADNYTITDVNGTLTVSPAALTVTADNAIRIFGTPNPTFSATIAGYVYGETSSVVSGSPSLSTTATIDSPVGTYPITAVQGTLSAANYSFTFVDGTLTVLLNAANTTSVYVLNGSAAGALTITGNAQLRIAGPLVVDSTSASAIDASGNAVVSAGNIQVVGHVQTSGNAQIAPNPVTGSAAVADPMSRLEIPSAAGLTSYGAVNLSGSDSRTINPGIYSGISVSGSARLTMNSGVYVIAGDGFSVSGNGSVSGDGVMIYNAGSNFPDIGGTFGGVTLSGIGDIRLSPMTAGTYAGVLIFQARDNSTAMSLSGNGMVMPGGLIYAPAAAVNMTGNGQFNGSLDVGTLNLSGNSIAQLSGASEGTVVFTPAQIRAAYGLNNLSLDGTGQTVAIVGAYDTPTIFQALDLFDAEFGLTESGPTLFEQYGPAASFLTVVNQYGQTTNLPGVDPVGAGTGNWEMEAALDVEWVHAIAPGARIILVETNGQSLADLMAGVRTAASLPGVSVVSLSWGMAEGQTISAEDELLYDSYLTTPAGHQGVTFVASTGDFGAAYPVYPAFSPNVVAVGGTSLVLNANGTYSAEAGWGYDDSDLGNQFVGSGGGLSRYEAEPAYQLSVQSTGRRTTPDVSFVADPLTGTWVADPYNLPADDPWEIVGGTSLSAPCWAGMFILANQGRVASGGQTLGTADPMAAQKALYTAPVSDFNDITGGTNGVYGAGAGYDLVTGLGTPIASRLIPDLINYDGTRTSERTVTVTSGSADPGSVDADSVTVFHARIIGGHGAHRTHRKEQASHSLTVSDGLPVRPILESTPIIAVGPATKPVASDASETSVDRATTATQGLPVERQEARSIATAFRVDAATMLPIVTWHDNYLTGFFASSGVVESIDSETAFTHKVNDLRTALSDWTSPESAPIRVVPNRSVGTAAELDQWNAEVNAHNHGKVADWYLVYLAGALHDEDETLAVAGVSIA